MLDRDSVTWRYAGDARMLPFLGRAFLLQAAHPTIGAGVADHSVFKTDPFGRFEKSWGLVLRVVYDADGARVGADVRASHAVIKGTKPDGSAYHAWEPEAYFWVLATGYDTIVTTAARFHRPMSPADERRAYDETRALGLRFGLRDEDMPPTLEAFRSWYARVLDTRLERNDTVRDVLTTLRRPNPPHGFPAALWPLPRAITAELGRLATVGTLPPRTRARLGIPWSGWDETRLAAIARVFRTLSMAPARWFHLPPARAAFARTADPSFATATPEAPPPR